VLGYWGIRGRGQVLRLLLAYTGVSWREKTYTDPAGWFEGDKKTIGMTYPNLPYIIDGNLKMSETLPLARFIANRSEKKDLLGKDIKDQAYVDNILGVYNDMMIAVGELFFH
jgi:glutathione S-transferase